MLPMNETRSEVEALFINPMCVRPCTPCFLEALSVEIMKRGVVQLWNISSETTPTLAHFDRLNFIYLIGIIFESAAMYNSQRDLMCYIARDSAIWTCLLLELVDMKQIFRKCVKLEMILLMRMIPFIRGPSAKDLISNSRLLTCLTRLLDHSRSHIVSMSAQTLITLLLGKHGERVVKKLLSSNVTTNIIQVVFNHYLCESSDYFCDCTCVDDGFSSDSRLLAMHDVLLVWYFFSFLFFELYLDIVMLWGNYFLHFKVKFTF